MKTDNDDSRPDTLVELHIDCDACFHNKFKIPCPFWTACNSQRLELDEYGDFVHSVERLRKDVTI